MQWGDHGGDEVLLLQTADNSQQENGPKKASDGGVPVKRNALLDKANRPTLLDGSKLNSVTSSFISNKVHFIFHIHSAFYQVCTMGLLYTCTDGCIVT